MSLHSTGKSRTLKYKTGFDSVGLTERTNEKNKTYCNTTLHGAGLLEQGRIWLSRRDIGAR